MSRAAPNNVEHIRPLSRNLRRTEMKPRRGLRREEAALYIGISPTKFDELVEDGRMPRPKGIDKAKVWDIHLLDAAFDALDEGQGEGKNDPWSKVSL